MNAQEIRILNSIQRKLIWISTYMIHYANFIRPNETKEKIGGHQASCSSLATIMTILFFKALKGSDKVAVKPHAGPIFHAVQMLKGKLPVDYLKKLRQFGGLQAYPSRTKDPDGVDISTGSLGMGAVGTGFGAFTDVLVGSLFGTHSLGRYIAIIGDAELDEGSLWEAIQERNLQELHNLIWVVDLNRQSLDRIVPSGKARQIEKMFEINNWHVIEVKYGSKLEKVFTRPHGPLLRKRIDLMENEEYQSLLMLPGSQIRTKLAEAPNGQFKKIKELLKPFNDEEVKSLLFDLGGHDVEKVAAGFEEAEKVKGKPTVIVAYTIKGWSLPIAADPMNHALLLTSEQIEDLRKAMGITEGAEFDGFPEGSPEGLYIRQFEDKLEAESKWFKKKLLRSRTMPALPQQIGTKFQGTVSTQQAFGNILMSLTKFPEIAQRIITVSPDVSISTNIGGWINEMGVFSRATLTDYYQENKIFRMLKWRQTPKGHHIELGISENNLFLALAMLGLSHSLTGEPLIPIGTIYDAFIKRALDSLMYGAYSGAKFIIVGTPSGVSLGPEGGSHQSLLTPSIGIEVPNVVYYEPCFARELEWLFLESIRRIFNPHDSSIVYLRLSTKNIVQDPFDQVVVRHKDGSRFMNMVVRGGYRLVDYADNPGYNPLRNVVNIFASGTAIPEAITASGNLRKEGVFANVINVTSPSLLYQGLYVSRNINMKSQDSSTKGHLEHLIPWSERGVPIVTVMDGHPHALSFLGGFFGARILSLGVSHFGQSGTQKEIYDFYDINARAIIQAVKYMIDSPYDGAQHVGVR